MGNRRWILFPSALFFPLIMSFTLPILFIEKKNTYPIIASKRFPGCSAPRGGPQGNIPEREKIVLKGHP
jgi:hypothetical protein